MISIHNIIIIAINLFRRVYDVQCVPCRRKPLQLHVLLTTCNLTTCYKKCLMTVIAVTRHYQRQFIRPSLRPLACHWKSITKPKVNNRNTRTSCEICSKLTLKKQERHLLSTFRCYYSILFTHFTTYLVFVLFTLNMQWPTVFLLWRDTYRSGHVKLLRKKFALQIQRKLRNV